MAMVCVHSRRVARPASRQKSWVVKQAAHVLLQETAGKALNAINYGNVMMAAVRDYAKELVDNERPQHQAHSNVDVDDLLDDPELEKLHADRLAALKQEAEKRAELVRKGHGKYEEVSEGDFLEAVRQADSTVCHFFHKEFERCKIVDKHLGQLCRKFLETRFIKVSAPDAPFFTVKLGIKVLPCVIFFKQGVAVDRIVGFEQLGGKDDFSTGAFEARLQKAGILDAVGGGRAGGRGRGGDESEEEEAYATSIRRGGETGGRADGDESSDFDD